MSAHRSRCHCGAVVLEIARMEPLTRMGRCDCSFCRRRGAAMIGAACQDVTLVQGQDALTSYQFGTRAAEHFFCKICGIYTHHRRRIDGGQYGLNVGCIEGLDARIADRAVWWDGVTHPSDRAAPSDPSEA